MRWLLILVVLSSIVFAMDFPTVIRVEMNMDKGKFVVVSVEKTHGYVEESRGNDDFHLDLVNILDEVRFTTNFTFPHGVSYTRSAECFIGEGIVDPDLCGRPSYENLTDATIIIDVPYYRTAKAINIYEGEALIETIDLSKFTEFCGDGVCSSSESAVTCTVDCDPNLEKIENLEIPANIGGSTHVNDSNGNKNLLIGVLIGVIIVLLVILILRNRR